MLNDNLGSLGFLAVGIFAASWVVSVAFYAIKRYDAEVLPD